MNRFLLYLFSLSIFSFPLLAHETFIINEKLESHNLKSQLRLIEDKEGNFNFEDVINIPDESWSKTNKDPSFGYTNSTHWAKVSIKSIKENLFYLEISYPHLDFIDLYYYNQEGNLIQKKTGDYLPFESRDLKYKNFVFLINQKENTTIEYFFKIKSQGALLFPITIWSPKAFAETKFIELIFLGLYFGLIIGMFFYNLFILISTREINYLYYILFLLFYSINVLMYNGLVYHYFWVGSPHLYNITFSTIVLYLPIFFSLIFSSKFLYLKNNLPLLNKFNNAIIIGTLSLGLISPFIEYRIGSFLGLYLQNFISVWLFIIGSILVYKKFRPAKFYLIAWSSFLAGTFIANLPLLGIIPNNLLSKYSILLGSSIESILLSLGLADRINQLKKQNELSQKELLETERNINKSKDEFLSNLSHELKTPLSSIYAYSELQLTKKIYKEKYSNEIYKSAGLLNNYINDLLLVTDIESNIQLQKSETSLNSLILKSLESNQHLIEPKSINTTLNVGQDFTLNCDSVLLTKSLSAIIKNAIVYNKDKGSILIELNKNTQSYKIIISIKDTGIGIKEDYHQKIFEKFFRVDSSLTYEVSGVGLGLFIAKKVIELHGGSIEVKSKLGKGSEFVVYLT